MVNNMLARRILAMAVVAVPVLVLFTNATVVDSKEKRVQEAMLDLDHIDEVAADKALGKEAKKYLNLHKQIILNFIAAQKVLPNCSALLAYEPNLSNGIYHLYPQGNIERPYAVLCKNVNGKVTTQVLHELEVAVIARNYKPVPKLKASTEKPADPVLVEQFRQIRALYLELLGREPDAAGWEGWVNGLRRGMSLAEIRKQFLSSPEYKALQAKKNLEVYRQQVRALYLELLEREPDAGGWNAWVANMQRGMSLAEVRKNFLSSPEYKALQAKKAQNFKAAADKLLAAMKAAQATQAKLVAEKAAKEKAAAEAAAKAKAAAAAKGKSSSASKMIEVPNKKSRGSNR